ncbi:hypothetical protein NMG60_11022063 [Bertholletia excelsa]
MEKQTTYFMYFYLLLSITITSGSVAEADIHEHGARNYSRSHGAVKLFVFGDSYADTGNCPKSFAGSWKQPYGITFPGKPAGRFSDGRVLTDYIASFLRIPSPIPYERRKFGKKLVPFGMNFAYGGTGVLNTMVKEPNMTTQINLFQQVLEEKLYTKHDLNSSIALVSVGGNDYGTYMATNGSLEGLSSFAETVIKQLRMNLRRLHGMGVKKIAVTAMEPLGCLPTVTYSTSYKNCSEAENSLASLHNHMLQQTLRSLNNETSDEDRRAFVIVDLHTAFLSALTKIKAKHAENYTYNPLKPCCEGTERGYACGNVDGKTGAKKYLVCEKPELSFFWDMIHPAQHGWLAVYKALKSSLRHLLLL